MIGQIALVIRTQVLYPLGGFVSSWVAFVKFDEQTGQLVVDINAAAVVIAGIVWTAITGGTFGLSRLAKKLGWAT